MQKMERTMENTRPLSLSQENIWSLERSFPGTPMNNICATMRIRGRLDIALIQKSLNMVIESDSSLRTRLVLIDGVPRQYQAEHVESPAPFFDFTMTNQSGFHQWETAVTRDLMPLVEAPLFFFAIFKLGENDGGLLIKTHHLISDGWSQVLIGNRFSELYLRFLSAVPEQYGDITIEPACSYTEHIDAEQKYLSSSAYKRDQRFWDEKLEGCPEPAMLKEVISASVSPVGQRKTFDLSELLNHAISRFCAEYRVAPFSVIYMALAAYLNRISGQDRLCIGVPILNRMNLAEKLTTGMFVSTLPFINKVDEAWSFAEFNRVLTEQWFGLLKHQRFPFSRMMELAKKYDPEQTKLFHIALSYQNSKLTASDNASVSFSGDWHYSGYQAEHLCIHLSHLEDQHRYSISYDYLAQIFSEREIDGLHRYLVNILSEGLSNPDRPISRFSVIGDEEKEKVLFGFNRSSVVRYKNEITQQWNEVLELHPTRVAVIQSGEKVTYRELSRRGDRYAAELLQRFPEEKIVAALLLPKGFSLFEAMVGVLHSGNAWVILPTDIPVGRLREILEDSGASIIVTNRALQQAYELEDAPCLTVESCAFLPLPEEPVRRPGGKDDLAYIVYTSGSTGKPKGVEIGQGNLLNFALSMKEYYGHGGVLSLCNTGFDVFILESVAALLCGRTVVLPTAEEQESPAKLAMLIYRYAVGFLAITPSRLAAFLQNGEFFSAAGKLDSIVCGGESFPPDLLQLLQLYTHANIYNQYGPSETTVAVSMKRLNDAQAVTIGNPMENCRLYVLDKNLLPLPIGVYGDLYVGGACVGKGYRNLPERTKEAFFESPFEQNEHIYKTGDIGRWTEGGEIILSGRKDQQIKLRGLRIEPQEIAARISMHPQVHEAAVRVVEQNGQSVIAAYYTAAGEITELQLLGFCANYLPSYMIPACLVRVENIPLTTHGKADLDKLPLPNLEMREQEAQTEIQETVVDLFRRVLKRDDIDAGSDYFLCGGDSLNALEVLSELEGEFNITLRIADMYACRTALRLEERICDAKGMPLAITPAKQTIVSAPVRESYPLTSVQQSLYFQTQLDPSKLSYNMPGAFRLPEGIDLERLKQALCTLVQKEPMLRVSFALEEAKVVQKVAQRTDFVVEELDASDFDEACKRFLHPFDLSKAPLFRAALWREESAGNILFVDLHHTVCDGISSSLLLRRLNGLYRGEPFAEKLTYLDYACWREEKEKKLDQKTADYWRSAVAVEGDGLELPADFSRPKRFDYRGLKQVFALAPELSDACDTYCEANDVSSYMLFAGVFGILLSKLSGVQDFLIGTPVSGRSKQEFWDVFGTFINTLPLRLRPSREHTVSEYLQQVKEQVIGMLDHQEISVDEIIKLAGTERSLEKNALYSVMFSQRPLSSEDFVLGGARLDYLPLQTGTAKLDLNLEAYKENGCYGFTFEYASSLFEAETVAYYGRCFRRILEEVLKDDSVVLYDIPALAVEDQLALVDIPNHTTTPYLNLPVDVLIDRNAETKPDRPAVVFHDETVSYCEFKRRSDALAGLLQELGVVRGDAVAFCLRRGADIPIAMAAINKAGAAYIPTTTSLPENRLEYMLENAGAKLLLCDEVTRPQLQNLPCPVQLISYDHPPLAPVEGRNGADIMHILYTSGSTGKPKGVMIRHSNLSNLLPCVEEMLHDIGGDFLCIANPIFDVFITETLFQLALNRTIVMADEEEMMLPWKMAELVEKHRISMLQFTPSRLQMCLNNEVFVTALAGVKFMIVCGEVFQPQLLKQLKEATSAKIVTMYGPTEVTVYMTMADLTETDRITVGKPMQNSRVYALDENLRPVIPTACGELYIAGECVSAGYVNRPDLTEASYLPDPYFPGQVMYRSGDIGRLRLDGYYDFIGRRDNQVKLNGQRIELDEITGQLLAVPGVKEAATAALKKEDGSMLLRGFFVYEGMPDLSQMKKHLAENLPAFMVPSVLTRLDEMPRTPTGKTDMVQLATWKDEAEVQPTPVPVSQPAANPVSPVPTKEQVAAGDLAEQNVKAEVALKTTLEGQLTALWRKTLERNDVSETLSFFEQGGTSLAALNLLSFYFSAGWSMTLEQFYENPTIEAQVGLLRDGHLERPAVTPDELPAPPAQAATAAKPAAAVLTQEDTRRVIIDLPATPPENGKVVLLTGATGFLGAHLIQALVERGMKKIVCPVRGNDPARLYESLSYYFGEEWTGQVKPYLQVVSGDISRPMLGLDFSALPKVDYLLHAAADVRHYVADGSSVETNRKGTEHVVALARELGAMLLHVSTASVSGEYLLDTPNSRCIFTETDRDIGQNWQENSYVKGKFLAEQLVLEAAEQGLPVKVFRIGRLVGRSADGTFQKNPEQNTFYALLRGMMLLDCFPASLENLPIELCAVDRCAKAIVTLMDSGRQQVYHVINPHTIPLGGLVKRFNRGIRPVEDAAFERHLSELIVAGYAAQISVLLDLWNRVKRHPTRIYPSAVRTVLDLAARSFIWEEPDPAVLLQAFLR